MPAKKNKLLKVAGMALSSKSTKSPASKIKRAANSAYKSVSKGNLNKVVKNVIPKRSARKR